ncbi:hypothetical protein K449DRAFT_431992 [Hypoxylon sp. EC38]|nr:hypothetical protein K449DRAFT_431992 [Hypoxylon sp. EC38]
MSTIGEHVASCLESFNSIIVDTVPDLSNQSTVSRIADEFARFKVWSGNIGAHRSRKSSLDYRLRDASHLQKQVKSLLVDLNDSLKNALAILRGERTPWDELPSEGENLDRDLDGPVGGFVEFKTEVAQISADIKEVVDCLLRLSVSIRNPAPHDRLKAYTRINVSHYEAHDISHISEKFRLASPKLAEHLGKANSRRRQFFLYRDSHHNILSEGLNEDSKLSTVASSIPPYLKDDLLDVGLGPIDEDELSESGVTQTSYATTRGGSDRLYVPALPAMASKGPFECPFCYSMITVSSKRAWKKHIFADLRPYNCLVLDCPVIGSDFARRHMWIDHMLQEHWRLWHCAFCSHQPFYSSERLRGHLQNYHLNTASDDQIRASMELCTSSRPLDSVSNCPLCQELMSSVNEYKRHVGRHLEDIALFVLPHALDDDNGIEIPEKKPLHNSDGSFATASSASNSPKEEGTAGSGSTLEIERKEIRAIRETFSLRKTDSAFSIRNDFPIAPAYVRNDTDPDPSQLRSPPPPDIDPGPSQLRSLPLPDMDPAVVEGFEDLNPYSAYRTYTDTKRSRSPSPPRRSRARNSLLKEFVATKPPNL